MFEHAHTNKKIKTIEKCFDGHQEPHQKQKNTTTPPNRKLEIQHQHRMKPETYKIPPS